MKWVKIKERLPVQSVDVLLTDGNWIVIGFLSVYGGWIFQWDYEFDPEFVERESKMTHWMPLPKPPEVHSS